MAPGWDGGSTEALGWDRRSWGAVYRNELRSPRLRRWELGGSSHEWKKLIDSKLEQRRLDGSRMRSLAQLQVIRHGSRGRRGLGSFGLRRGELGDSRLKIELGGSRLR